MHQTILGQLMKTGPFTAWLGYCVFRRHGTTRVSVKLPQHRTNPNETQPEATGINVKSNPFFVRDLDAAIRGPTTFNHALEAILF